MGNTLYLFDTNSDTGPEIIDNETIRCVGLGYVYRGGNYIDDFGKTISYHDFYQSMREDVPVGSYQVNAQTFLDIFEETVRAGKSIVYYGFSSKLSGTLQAAELAKSMLLETCPQADITIIDSLNVTLGVGMQAYAVADMIKEGKSKEEIIEMLVSARDYISTYFTVDDLKYLKRGGRISATNAAIGGMLNIRPILRVAEDGTLTTVKKVQGRKKSMTTLVDFMQERVDERFMKAYIAHADSEEDALTLSQMVTERFGIENPIIRPLNMSVGSHAGPGTLVLAFRSRMKKDE